MCVCVFSGGWADKTNLSSELSKYKQSKSTTLKVMSLVMHWLRDIVNLKPKANCHFCLIVQASLI